MNSTASDLSPHEYRNPILEQKIAEQIHRTDLDISNAQLSDSDMEILVSYAIQKSKVKLLSGNCNSCENIRCDRMANTIPREFFNTFHDLIVRW